jgi:hypothetical protein
MRAGADAIDRLVDAGLREFARQVRVARALEALEPAILAALPHDAAAGALVVVTIGDHRGAVSGHVVGAGGCYAAVWGDAQVRRRAAAAAAAGVTARTVWATRCR